jgi:hypothetical protein
VLAVIAVASGIIITGIILSGFFVLNSGPMPLITLLYQGKQYFGHYQPPLGAGAYSPDQANKQAGCPSCLLGISPVNVTYGSVVQFELVNSSSPPSFYSVSIFDLGTMTKQSNSIVIKNARFDTNSITIGPSGDTRYFEPNKKYELDIAGIWPRMSLAGYREDYVSYQFLVDTKG